MSYPGPVFSSTDDEFSLFWLSHTCVQVMATLIPSFSAVIAALNIWLGADVGGYFLEVVATELNLELERAKGGGGGGGSSRRGRGTASNLLLLLAHLYNFGVTYCTLIYDIVRLLVEGAFLRRERLAGGYPGFPGQRRRHATSVRQLFCTMMVEVSGVEGRGSRVGDRESGSARVPMEPSVVFSIGLVGVFGLLL